MPSLWVDGFQLRELIFSWALSFEASHERKPVHATSFDTTLTARQALVERTSLAGHPVSEMTISRIMNGRNGEPVRRVPYRTAEPLVVFGMDKPYVFSNGELEVFSGSRR